MSIYSFLIAVRSDGQQLQSDTGETTSHLMGMFYRTLRIVDNGIKPLTSLTAPHQSSSPANWPSGSNARARLSLHRRRPRKREQQRM